MLTLHRSTAGLSNAHYFSERTSPLGTRLHDARTRQAISIAVAAAATHILPCYLAALEAGAYHALPGPVCTRGFIRNYGQYLDIPCEELIALYQREYGPLEPIRIVPAIPSAHISRMLPSFLGVGLVVLLLIATSYMLLSVLY